MKERDWLPVAVYPGEPSQAEATMGWLISA